MSKINPKATTLIDEYINSKDIFFKETCELLRSLIHKADKNVLEDWKWRIPVFQKNVMVCGFACFKNHISLTFFNGALLSNKHLLFTEDCNAQNTRTIKFQKGVEINKNYVLDYFTEAFSLSDTQTKKVVKKKEIRIPELLLNALKNNKLASENYSKMAYTYRKEYALHISEAKRESTKLKRLEKVINNLEKNIKMHEQYKC